MTYQPAKASVDNLPKQFLSSMKVLFDILDDKGSGCVRLRDIESRWEGGVTGLPTGVVESLRKVTPSSGELTFERFVAGLQIALLRVAPDAKKSSPQQGHTQPQHSKSLSSDSQTGATSSFGQKPDLLNHDNALPSTLFHQKSQQNTKFLSSYPQPSPALFTQSLRTSSKPTTAAVKPNNAILNQRPASISTEQVPGSAYRTDQVPPFNSASTGPRTFPQNGSASTSSAFAVPTEPPPKARESNIVFALKGWQKDGLPESSQYSNALRQSGRQPSESRASIALSSFDNYGGDAIAQSRENAAAYKRVKKKEPRRHTLANGVDYNMIKRMKQLEQEKDVLLQGLQAVDKARTWYTQQVQVVLEKQKYGGKGSSPNDYSLEANQERMNFQMTRIQEVNQQLKALVDSSEKGFPLHMNLAVRKPQSPNRQEISDQQNRISMLQAQNKMLTQDMNKKNDRILQLEKEKSTLIRDMFAKSNQRASTYHDDTTFL